MKALRSALLATLLSCLSFAQTITLPGQSTPVSLTWLYYNKMRWAGAWSSSTTYNPQDVVSYGGASYVSLSVANLNNTPTVGPWWALLPNAFSLPAGSPVQYLRVQPNIIGTTYQFATISPLNAADYNFPAQAPGGSLVAGGVGQSIALAPCPLGLNAADTGHYVKLSAGTGATEGTLITGGTCTSGAASGTITVTPANAHSGAWTVASATGGIQEAINSIGATVGWYGGGGIGTGGGKVFAPNGTYSVYGGPILVPSNVELSGVFGSTYLQPTTTGQTMIRLDHAKNATVSNLTCIANFTNNTCYDLDAAQMSTLKGLEVIGGNTIVGKGLYMHCSAFATTDDNTYGNTIEDFHAEIAPSRPLVLEGHGITGPGVVTGNHLTRINIQGGDAVHPLIDIVQNADTNYWMDLALGSSIGTTGISIGIGDGATDMQVGGNEFDRLNVYVVGAMARAVVVGVAPIVSVRNLVTWSTYPYVLVSGTTGFTCTNCKSINSITGATGTFTEMFASGGFSFGSLGSPTSVAFGGNSITLVNGLNSDIAIGNTSWEYISGPTAPFSIGGIAPMRDGHLLILYNSTAFAMTIKQEDGSSTAVNRISTLTGADVVMRTGTAAVFLIYSGTVNRWIQITPQQSASLTAAETLANAATAANTVSTIVKRDSSGGFAAGAVGLAAVNYIAAEAGGSADNAITGTLAGVTVGDGLCVTQQLTTHTLQAGANTYALNGGSAVAIKKHTNAASNLGTAYAATGRPTLCYNSTGPVWMDMGQ